MEWRIVPAREPLPFVSRPTRFPWWLSVDNRLPSLNHMGGIDVLRSSQAVHLGQSWYALDWLASHGVTGQPSFEPLARHCQALVAAPPEPRPQDILYSPKGSDFTALPRQRAPDLDWVEPSGFTSQEMRGLFWVAMLYVDFGNHPGPDRMPREAAALGCCVITGRHRSIGNDRDVPPPRRYEFQDRLLFIPWMLWAIRYMLAGYDRGIGDAARYRRVIAAERGVFDAQGAGIFRDGSGAAPPRRPTRLLACSGDARTKGRHGAFRCVQRDSYGLRRQRRQVCPAPPIHIRRR